MHWRKPEQGGVAIPKQGKAEPPLKPYRVLDLTDEKGFLCGMILGELGAEVIKIERPGGDPVRSRGPFYHDIPHREKSLYWFAYNVNKKGITLDIETADGREIFGRLVETADFVIESFSPGYMDGLGLGYEALSGINPRIILTSITPFGQTGPYKDWKGSDITFMAMSGMMHISGDPDRPPLRVSIELAYPQAGAQAAAGTMIAHYHRLITGEGQHVDISVHEAAACACHIVAVDWGIRRLLPPDMKPAMREGARGWRDPVLIRLIWPCKDGHVSWRVLVGVLARRTYAVVEWMVSEGMGEEVKDVKWEEYDFNKLSQEELDSWEESFMKFFKTKTKAELHEGSVKRGIQLYPFSAINDLVQNPQLKAREWWAEIEHPELATKLTYPGPVFKSSEYYCGPRFRAPFIGEHNEEIYVKELGLSKGTLALLANRGVI